MAKPTKEELAVIKEDSKNLLTAQEAKDLKTIADIEARFTTTGGKVYDITEVSPDFTLVDASSLVNIPFTVAHFEPRYSDDFGKFNEDGLFVKGKYYSVYVITDDNKQLVFNDGGTGIVPVADNFIEVTKQTGGMRCPWGLRSSSYDWVNDKTGEKGKATTMYFATSKPKTT